MSVLLKIISWHSRKINKLLQSLSDYCLAQPNTSMGPQLIVPHIIDFKYSISNFHMHAALTAIGIDGPKMQWIDTTLQLLCA